ncbi:transposase [Dyadobacter diqingensis]|uniref:transposase n=1 Tax=Dyadobacter diqingensis TaxID=2938121 RepID=UPI0020C19257|nr:transposase [Dyadobacter diqingensis]
MQFTLFPLDFEYTSKWYNFKTTELGRIHDCVDWDGLTALLPKKETLRGAPSWLPQKGLLGMMFLKHYTGLSDEKLLARFNTDWAMQLFCGMLLTDNESIKDNSFISKVRCYLGRNVDMIEVQKVLIKAWKKEIPDKNVLLMDATCYEVHLRFPTDVKILWESCGWIWEKKISELCKLNKLRLPRSKYKEQKIKTTTYSKIRKKTHRKTKARKNALLKLLAKGIEIYQDLLNQVHGRGLTEIDSKTFKTIKLVYQQQKHHFNHPNAKIKDRIVSIYKPYIRPIVRGKENKPVEFGLKAHKLQVGGISILEHVSYKAFNECKRLKTSILKHKIIFGQCSHVGADAIYATNENRKFTTKEAIITNFIRKGRGKDDKPTKLIKTVLNKERSTRLEPGGRSRELRK